MSKILDLTTVIRSKNAGPFAITFDMIFKDADIYNKVKASGVITKEQVAELYGVNVEKIIAYVWFDVANSLKITMLRTSPSGKMGDRDVYGAQQHVPLLGFEFPF